MDILSQIIKEIHAIFPDNTMLARALQTAFYEEDRQRYREKLRRSIEKKAYTEAIQTINELLEKPKMLQPYLPCRELHKIMKDTKQIQDKEIRIQLCMGSVVLNFSKKRLENLKQEIIRNVRSSE